jgi:ABC-type branched-subunit amino acid transport system substrate-binding protein
MRPSSMIARWTCAGVLSAGIAGCGGDESNTARDAENLVIGNSVPLSGSLASWGPAGDKAAELAVEEIRMAIAITGGQETVSLETADNGTNPETAVDAANDLASEGASCIAGPWRSMDTIEMARSVTIPKGILAISPASGASEISTLDDEGLVSRTVLPARYQGPALADAATFLLLGAEGRIANLGARKDSYGTPVADGFAREWRRLGGSIGERVDYAPGRRDYGAQAKRITAGNPDLTVIIDRSDNFTALGRALARTGDWDPTRAWGSDGLASGGLLQDPGPKAVEGMHVLAPGVPQAAPLRAFKRRFASTEPTDVRPQAFSAQTFDAVILCYLSFIAAKSADGTRMAGELQEITGPPGRKYTWQQLPGAVSALLRGRDIDYVGASGELDLDAKGDPTKGAYDLLELEEGLTKVGSVPVPASE